MDDITSRFVKIYTYLYDNKIVKSDAQLAKKIGVGASAISNILKGLSKVSIKVISGVAMAYAGVSVDWFVTGRGEMLVNKTSPASSDTRDGKTVEIDADVIMSLLMDIKSDQEYIKTNFSKVLNLGISTEEQLKDKSLPDDLVKRALKKLDDLRVDLEGQASKPVIHKGEEGKK